MRESSIFSVLPRLFLSGDKTILSRDCSHHVMNKLSRAPLQEVIFEVRWDLQVNAQTRQEFDPKVELALGKLQGFARNKFPFYRRKMPQEIPVHALPYQAVHQFWRDQRVWPVIQLGPGIFTVNDTDKNYEWTSSYFPQIEECLFWLYEAYDNDLRVRFCNLNYIDVIKLKDHGNPDDLRDFIAGNLKVRVSNEFQSPGSRGGINIMQTFNLEDGSMLSLVIADGLDQKTQDPILMWQTGITANQPFDKDRVLVWCQTAHSIVSDLFKEMTKGRLYDSFT